MFGRRQTPATVPEGRRKKGRGEGAVEGRKERGGTRSRTTRSGLCRSQDIQHGALVSKSTLDSAAPCPKDPGPRTRNPDVGGGCLSPTNASKGAGNLVNVSHSLGIRNCSFAYARGGRAARIEK